MLKRFVVLFFGAAALLLAQTAPGVRFVRCVDAGSNDTYTCTPADTVAAWSDLAPSGENKIFISFVPNTANTGAATLQIGSLSALTIVKDVGGVGQTLADNDFRAKGEYLLAYDTTNTRLVTVNWPGNASSGGATTTTQIHSFEILATPGGSATNYPFWLMPTAATDSASSGRVGTAPNQYGYLLFDDADTNGSRAQRAFLLHANYTTGGTLKFIWSSSANVTTNVRWIVKVRCEAPGANRSDGTWADAGAEAVVAQAGSVNHVLQTTSINANMGSCAGGNLIHVQLLRDGQHASDTSTTDVAVYAAEFSYTRTL